MINQAPSLFVLDTNIFVEAHRRYYAQDLCPGFWDCLTYYCGKGRVLSIDRVRDEMLNNEDQLSEWVDQAPDSLFVSSADPEVVNAFTDMMDWVQGNDQFLPEAKVEFATVADGWLAAYARVHNAVVVLLKRYLTKMRRKGYPCQMYVVSLMLITETLLRCCASLRSVLTGDVLHDHFDLRCCSVIDG